MLKIKTLLIVLITICTICGCKKDTKLVVVYELKTSVPITNAPTIITKFGYTTRTFTDFTSGTSWSKSIEEETEHRPLPVYLNAQNVFLNGPGSVVVSIYVNNELKVTNTFQAVLYGSQYSASTAPLDYTIE